MRGRTVTVQCLDSKSWTVTVKCLLMSNLDSLGGKIGFSFLQKTWNLVSLLSNETNLTPN
jgi:hypothetical protein